MNIQGIFSIESYPAKQVKLPQLFKHQTVTLENYTTVAPKTFNFIKGSASMKVTPKTHDAGKLHNIVVSFTIAGNSPTQLAELDYQSNIPHVFRITDNTGQRYILGFDGGPISELSYTLKNDGDGKGGRSIGVKITLLTHLFPIYAPPIQQEAVNQPDDPEV